MNDKREKKTHSNYQYCILIALLLLITNFSLRLASLHANI